MMTRYLMRNPQFPEISVRNKFRDNTVKNDILDPFKFTDYGIKEVDILPYSILPYSLF